LVSQALKNEPITVYGDGKQTRCFTYVSDVVKAFIDLANHPAAIGQIFNVGNDRSITIKELAYLIKRMTNSSSEIIFIPYDQAYEEGFEDMRIRIPDISKIRNLIGYQPKMSLEGILEKVIEYAKKEQD